MFARPGLCGMGIGRLGLVAASRPSLVAQALAILAKYGSAANLYLPGVGAINGIQAGNWLDSVGTTGATVDNQVGLVVSAGKELGPELIDYSIGALGSNYVIRGTSVAVGGGFYTVTGNNAIASTVASQNPLLGVNKTYKVTLSIQSAGPVALHLSDAQNSGVNPSPFLSQSSVGTYDAVITTDFTKDTITAFCGGTGVSTTFKVSVRELPGAHLTQSTAANRPVLRRGPVNQLLWSRDFTQAAWVSGNASVAPDAVIAPDGYAATKLTENSATSTHQVQQTAATPGGPVTLVAILRASDRTSANLSAYDQVAGTTKANAFFNLTTGAVSQSVTGTATIASLGSGWYVCASTSTEMVAGSLIGWIRTAVGTSASYAGDGVSGILINRAALFQGAVTAQQIIDAGGIPLTTTAPASSTNGRFAWDFVSSDSFTSALTPGNAGFFCLGVRFSDGSVARSLIGAGAGSSSESGVWLARNSVNALRLQVGDGSALNAVSAAYPAYTNAVASAGWGSSTMFVGVNNTETSGAKSVNCTSSNTINVGVLTGTTNPMLGTIGATIIMPTVLPTVSERATLRQFIASLSGVTM